MKLKLYAFNTSKPALASMQIERQAALNSSRHGKKNMNLY